MISKEQRKISEEYIKRLRKNSEFLTKLHSKYKEEINYCKIINEAKEKMKNNYLKVLDYSKIITVDLSQTLDIFLATSEDLKGLYVCDRDIVELFKEIPNVIKVIYKASKGMDVKVQQAPFDIGRNRVEGINNIKYIVKEINNKDIKE